MAAVSRDAAGYPHFELSLLPGAQPYRAVRALRALFSLPRQRSSQLYLRAFTDRPFMECFGLVHRIPRWTAADQDKAPPADTAGALLRSHQRGGAERAG